MQSEYSETEQQFADQVERFIAEHWLNKAQPGVRHRAWSDDSQTRPLRQQWYRRVVEAGWSVPHWPTEFGGCDWTPTQQHIWFSACMRHQTPPILTFATVHVGPLLIDLEHPQRHVLLPQIASFEHAWCLGWAELGSTLDDYALKARLYQERENTGHWRLRANKTRVLDGMTAQWMLCVALDDNEHSNVVATSLQQSGVTRVPKPTLSNGQPMADIQLTDVTVPSWGRFAVPVAELRQRLSGTTEADLTALADSAALLAQTQQLKQQLQKEANLESGLLRDCDALVVEVLGLKVMEQRALSPQRKDSGAQLPRAAVRLRAQGLWGKLSELQIAAFGYYALPFVDSVLADNEGSIDPRRSSGDLDMTMVMQRMLSPTIATELGLDPRDTLAQQALGLPEHED